jgi:DNA-binding XRE family transcriptional regulator
MDSRFEIRFDRAELAKALGVSEQDIQEYLTDGRRASFIIERRLKWDNPDWNLAPSEGAGFDLIDPTGNRWEVRSITRQGVYFNPSNQVGSGRVFNEAEFLNKLRSVAGFILADVTKFPLVPVFKFPVENVFDWHERRLLGANARVSYNVFYSRLLPIIRW